MATPKKLKNAAVMLTAVETARQWARRNPEQAADYIDRATGFVDQRTKGKYHRQIEGLSQNAKKSLTGAPTSRNRPFPDMRA